MQYKSYFKCMHTNYIMIYSITGFHTGGGEGEECNNHIKIIVHEVAHYSKEPDIYSVIYLWFRSCGCSST